MADIDEISVCESCLHPVNNLLIGCPKCRMPIRRTPSLLLPTLRILRAKGWVVDRWWIGSGVFVPAYPWRVTLAFMWFAPPVPVDTNKDGAMLAIELINNVPHVLVDKRHDEAAESVQFKVLYQWAKAAPCFSIPFAQDFCDKCRQQGGDWFFSTCYCPRRSGVDRPILTHLGAPITGDRRISFADGIPRHCIYADAHVVTLENRFKQLEPLFKRNPITRRKALRQLGRTAA